MSILSDLPNIGKTLAEKLYTIGIESEEDLQQLGAENTLIKLNTLSDSNTCLNMLYAIEGAIQGIRWHSLNKERKEILKDFYNSISK